MRESWGMGGLRPRAGGAEEKGGLVLFFTSPSLADSLTSTREERVRGGKKARK